MSRVGIIVGEIPVLLSAPHSRMHVRNGSQKMPERRTDEIVIEVAKQTGCSAIYLQEEVGYDPNHEDCEYRRFLDNLIVQHGIVLVLDIHGAKATHSFDIDIGTGPDYEGKEPFIAQVREEMSKGISNVTVDKVFPARKTDTITKYVVRNYQIHAVQLEINRNIRLDDSMMRIVVENLKNIVMKIGTLY